MQKELEELQPKLVVAQEENKKMMAVIEKESAEVEARSKVVREDEKAANEKAAEAQALKDEVRRLMGRDTSLDYYTNFLSLSLSLV